MRRLALALLLACIPSLGWAACANNWTVKDGAGASQTFCRGTDGGTNFISYFSLLDAAGVNVAAVTAGNALKVDASATTQPVSGTFWQATQPISGTVTSNQGGTWTVQPGNTANTTAWKVDGSAVTQPVSGTFWQATQPVSGTFWQATQPVSGTFWQATQPVSGTVAATQSGTWNDRMQDGSGTALTSTGGALDVNLKTSSITLPVSGTFWQATQPVSGTFWQATQPVSGTVTANQGGAPWSENITQINGTTLNLGQASTSNSLPVTMATNQSPIPIMQGPLTPPFTVNVANTGLAPIPVNVAKEVTAPPRCSSTICLSGSASSTSSSAVTIISAQPRPLWITGVQCGRTDAATTGMIVTLSDVSSTIVVLPNGGGGGGNNLPISPDAPLFVKPGTAFTFTPGTSVTTSYCSAQGYLG